MPNTFRPRGAPNAAPNADYYKDWELTNRPAMLPFLAEYTNTQTGAKSGGMAMPSMVTSPANALWQLVGPAGGMWDIENTQNADALREVNMATLGGEAFPAITRNALARGAVPNFETYASKWAATPAEERSMLHPGMEEGIRRLYGHGEYFTSGPRGIEVRERAKGLADSIRSYQAEIAKDPANEALYGPLIKDARRAIELYAGDARANDAFKHLGVEDSSISQPRSAAIEAQKQLADEGYKSVRYNDTVNTFRTDTIRSPLTGETLFSDTGRPSLMGSALASEQSSQSLLDLLRHNGMVY